VEHATGVELAFVIVFHHPPMALALVHNPSALRGTLNFSLEWSIKSQLFQEKLTQNALY
jgi:hypothetical protein